MLETLQRQMQATELPVAHAFREPIIADSRSLCGVRFGDIPHPKEAPPEKARCAACSFILEAT